MQIFLLYLFLGSVAGCLGGLFGIGGGSIVVPVLIYSFIALGHNPEVLTQIAIGTSLASIMVTSVSSVIAHHSSRAVLWPLVLQLMPGICFGTLAGGLIAAVTSGSVLQISFGLFLIAMACQMGLGTAPQARRPLPGAVGKWGISGGIGFLSGIFGIGGGSLTVPFLSWCSVGVRQAIATSAALGIPIALSGTLTYICAGWNKSGLPDYSLGYIYWPAVLGIALTSMPFARLGANLAHRLPERILRKLFSLVMLSVGLTFIFKNVLSWQVNR